MIALTYLARGIFGYPSSDVELWTERARLAQATGRLEDAFVSWKEVIRRDPNRVEGHFSLGSLYRSAGLPGLARRHLETVTRLSPDNPEAWATLAELCAADLGYSESLTSAFGEAEEAFRNASRLRPEKVFYRLGLADMESQNGKLVEAERNYREALAHEPDNADAVLRFARFLIEQRPLYRAEIKSLLEHADQIAPGNENALLLHAQWEKICGHPTAVISILEAIVKHRSYQSENSGIWYSLSQAYRRLGKTAQAEAALHRAQAIRERAAALRQQENVVRTHPDDITALSTLARMNRRAFRFAQALNCYQVCLQKEPQNRALRIEYDLLCEQLRREGRMPSMQGFNAMVQESVR